MQFDDVPAGAPDPARSDPLHIQLTTLIRARIADRSWPPGSALPTEAEFGRRFGVSRSVVRQSLAALAAEGLIQRGRGRASVVAPMKEHHRLVQRMPGLSAQIGQGVHVATQVLSIGPERNERAESELGSPEVLEIRRLRSAAGEPIALIHTWLRLSQAAGLTKNELTNASLHAVLRKRFGISIVSGGRQIRAVAATQDVAATLDIPLGSPVLLLQGTSHDEYGLPVEIFSTWHRADRVVFDIDVVREGRATQPREGPHDGAEGAPMDHLAPARAPDVPRRQDLAGRARAIARQLQEFSDSLDT